MCVFNSKDLPFFLSEKQEGSIPDEVFDAVDDSPVANVNFSKNLLTAVPPRYSTAMAIPFH